MRLADAFGKGLPARVVDGRSSLGQRPAADKACLGLHAFQRHFDAEFVCNGVLRAAVHIDDGIDGLDHFDFTVCAPSDGEFCIVGKEILGRVGGIVVGISGKELARHAIPDAILIIIQCHADLCAIGQRPDDVRLCAAVAPQQQVALLLVEHIPRNDGRAAQVDDRLRVRIDPAAAIVAKGEVIDDLSAAQIQRASGVEIDPAAAVLLAGLVPYDLASAHIERGIHHVDAAAVIIGNVLGDGAVRQGDYTGLRRIDAASASF